MIVPYKKLHDDQAVTVLRGRREGKTLRGLADELGISREQVRGLECRGMQLEEYIASDDPQYELSTRAMNVLLNGVGRPLTPERVRAHYQTVHELLLLPNMGRASVMEIQNWFKLHGLPLLPDRVPLGALSVRENDTAQQIRSLQEENQQLKADNAGLRDLLSGIKQRL